MSDHDEARDAIATEIERFLGDEATVTIKDPQVDEVVRPSSPFETPRDALYVSAVAAGYGHSLWTHRRALEDRGSWEAIAAILAGAIDGHRRIAAEAASS